MEYWPLSSAALRVAVLAFIPQIEKVRCPKSVSVSARARRGGETWAQYCTHTRHIIVLGYVHLWRAGCLRQDTRHDLNFWTAKNFGGAGMVGNGGVGWLREERMFKKVQDSQKDLSHA